MPSLDLSLTCDAGEEHAEYLDAKLRGAWAMIEGAPATLSVAVVDDATMADLHQRFLKVAGPTDVLTFDLGDGEGEVVVCLGEATRQAGERGHAVRDELLLYAVHGLLHLSGYDDLDADAYERMHAREDEILAAIGVGRLFRGDSAVASPPPRP